MEYAGAGCSLRITLPLYQNKRQITDDAFDVPETEPVGQGKVITMSFNGVVIEVPSCADNAIEFMLKDMLISEMTGDATQGNLKAVAAEIDKRFEALSE